MKSIIIATALAVLTAGAVAFYHSVIQLNFDAEIIYARLRFSLAATSSIICVEFSS